MRTKHSEIVPALAFGEATISRAVCDGQRGYRVTYTNGVTFFRFKLADAFRDIVKALGHEKDVDLFLIGERESGNAW